LLVTLGAEYSTLRGQLGPIVTTLAINQIEP